MALPAGSSLRSYGAQGEVAAKAERKPQEVPAVFVLQRDLSYVYCQCSHKAASPWRSYTR